MGFKEYANLIKDLAILAALGFILWFVTHAEHNADQLKNIKETLGQQQQWQKEQSNASKTANDSLQTLSNHLDDIDKRGPIVVRIPVPAKVGASAPASGSPTNTPGSGQGSCGDVRPVDIRPVLESLERKYGTALIECKQVIDSWPK